MTKRPTLRDVRLVLTTPASRGKTSKAVERSEIAFHRARNQFCNRAIPATWARLLETVKRLHTEVKRAEKMRETEARTGEPPGQSQGPETTPPGQGYPPSETKVTRPSAQRDHSKPSEAGRPRPQ